MLVLVKIVIMIMIKLLISVEAVESLQECWS